MRRCPRCTALTEEGTPCAACGHSAQPVRSVSPAAPDRFLLRPRITGEDVARPTAVAARRGRHGPPVKRPLGVSLLGWFGVGIGGLQALQALLGMVKLFRIQRELAESGFQDLIGTLFSLTLLAFFIGTTVIVVSLALLRGLRWAWWVTVVFYAVMIGNAFLVGVAAGGTALLFPAPFRALGVAALAVALFYMALFGTLVAYLFLPACRRYFFEPPSFLAPAPAAQQA